MRPLAQNLGSAGEVTTAVATQWNPIEEGLEPAHLSDIHSLTPLYAMEVQAQPRAGWEVGIEVGGEGSSWEGR